MSNKQQNFIKLFGDRQVRSVWDGEREKWFFSISDIISLLTDTADATSYIKKLKQRDPMLKVEWRNLVIFMLMETPGGEQKIRCSDTAGILRIIQSIPSKKAEPFKVWLAQVGAERLDEAADPELAINRAVEMYARKGFDREWINQRVQSIRVRKELVDEWNRCGVENTIEYAFLTDAISRGWSGMTTREYKDYKGLKKESLRDNMSTMELVLNMLAETTTAELSKKRNPNGFQESQSVAVEGGETAGEARKIIEKRLGSSVISRQNNLANIVPPKELPLDETADLNLLLDYVERHGSISISEAVLFLPNVSRRTLNRRLQKLIADGKLEAHGATNRKCYILPKSVL